MKRFSFLHYAVLVFFATQVTRLELVFAAIPPAEMSIEEIRKKVASSEQELLAVDSSAGNSKAVILKIRQLMKYQKQEKVAAAKRMAELKNVIATLSHRKTEVRERIESQGLRLRAYLQELHVLSKSVPATLLPPESERSESPKREFISNLAKQALREIEELKIDVEDADQLEAKIHAEESQLAYLIQDLKEQEGVLALNEMVQVDLAKRKKSERFEQLRNYSKIKVAQSQIDQMMGNLNARLELKRAMEAEKKLLQAFTGGEFVKLRGRLPLPAPGPIVGTYGRVFDAESRLYVFRKGIEISAGASKAVHSVASGSIAYSGFMPHFGNVALIDHGNHFYSLVAKLGTVEKRTGDPVLAGELLGKTDTSGSPVYFEIRAGNVAVNPMQWLAN